MENHIGALPRTPFPASRDFPSRGNEKIGGTGYCVTYDTDSQSRNVLASPLGEEGHEVAKRWTVVRMIMILDVGVTAERRHYKTHRPLKGKRLTTFCASLALLHPLLSLTHWIFRSLMLPYKSSSHSAKCVRCAPRGRYHHPRPEGPSPPERSEHNPTTQPAAEPRPLFYKNCGVSRHHHPLNPLNLLNPHAAGVSKGEAPLFFPLPCCGTMVWCSIQKFKYISKIFLFIRRWTS